jgi:molybdopterin synthase sulfur carrier subunit
MIEVTVKLFATLRDYLPRQCEGNSCTLEVGEGSTVGDVFRQLKIPREIKLLFLVNSTHADENRILNAGDMLSVFPPIGGG